jgi:hypothetical protein
MVEEAEEKLSLQKSVSNKKSHFRQFFSSKEDVLYVVKVS